MNKAGIKNVIGSNIRGLRLKRGISQDRLSKLADLSLNTIVKIEAGKNNNPTIVTLSRIARSFNVQVDELIKVILICVCLSIAGIQAGYGEEAALGERLITISKGISMVLKDGRLVKISNFDKDASFEDSVITRSALFPQVNASVAQTFQMYQPGAKIGALNVNTADRNAFSYGIDIYQTLFDFGKSMSNYEASKETFNSSKAKLEAVRRLAVLEFIVTYFDVLEAQKMILVYEKEVESLSSYLRDVEHMQEQGVAVRSDLLGAKVKLADAKQKLITARNAKTLVTAKLNNILALPLREKTVVKDIDMSTPAISSTEQSWKTALGERPEIEIADDLINASAMRQKAKITSHLPTLYAKAGYAYQQNSFVTHQDNAFINLGAKLDIFDGWKSEADSLKERVIHKQLSEQKAKLIEDIKLEIEDSSLGVKDAIEKVSVAKDVVEQAQENVRVTRVRYAQGIANSTEVLESVALWTGAQTNYFRADYELKRNYTMLMYSMGIDLALVYERMENKDEYGKY